jgi:hypothetical protein
MPRQILLDFGQLLYYAKQDYDWEQIKDRVVRTESTEPEPQPPDPGDETPFEEIDWLHRRS